MPTIGSVPQPLRTARVPAIGSRWGLPFLVLMLVSSVLASTYNYAMFHTLVEIYCTTIAAGVFIVVYNTRRFLDNDYLLFVGIGFLFFVFLGIPHTLGYKGLQLFANFDNDLPTQAFIAQRFLLASTVLIAPLFLSRRLWVRTTISLFAAVTGTALFSLLVWDNFPHMFIDGVGLTPVKKALELVLCAMFAAAGMLLFRARRAFEPDVLHLILASLGCFVGSELAFMLYATPFGLSNLGGHLLQVAAFHFAYRAVLVTALVNPFGLLFRELAASEQSLRAANAQLNAVADISGTAISTLELDELLPRLLERMVTVMHADAALVLLAEGKNLKSFASVGLPGVELTIPFGSGFSGTIASTRKPLFVFDAQDGDLSLINVIREQGIQSMLGVPLSVGDKLLGVLHVDWRTHHAFDDADLRLLEIVADRVALAIRNAQTYEGEHRIAQVLQGSILSMPDGIDGLEFAHLYHSATWEARVGGDFYDIFTLDDGLVGILIGDVSGKGIHAAVLTSLVKNTVRTHAQDVGTSPAEVIRRTNAMVERYSTPESFVTVFFALLDSRLGRLTYCNAGHTTVLIVRRDSRVTRLGSNSPLVGAFPDLVFTDSEAHVEPSEMLVMYTDGLTEARRGDELYGEDRLIAMLENKQDRNPQATVETLTHELLTFTGGDLSDDLAVLAVTFLGQGCETDDSGTPTKSSEATTWFADAAAH